MKSLPVLILLMIPAIILDGCSRKPDKRHLLSEEMIETHSDSTLDFSDTVDSSSFRKKVDLKLIYGAIGLKKMALKEKDYYNDSMDIIQNTIRSPYVQNPDSVYYGYFSYLSEEYEKAKTWLEPDSDRGGIMKNFVLNRYYEKDSDSYNELSRIIRYPDSISSAFHKNAINSPMMGNHNYFNRRLDQAVICELRLRNTLLEVAVILLLGVAVYILRCKQRRHSQQMAYNRSVIEDLNMSLVAEKNRLIKAYNLIDELKSALTTIEEKSVSENTPEPHTILTTELKETLEPAESKTNYTSGLLTALGEQECGFIEEIGQIMARYTNPTSVNIKLAAIIRKFIDSYSINGNRVQKLEEYSNLIHSGIVEDFRKEPLSLKDIDYRFFMYSVLGFSTTTIVLLLRESKIEKVYNRRHRIRTKLKALPEATRERYERYI